MNKFPVDKFYLIKFQKLKSSHSNLRLDESSDNSIVGYSPYLPKKGVRFLMFAKGLTKGSIRIIKTTYVIDIDIPTKDNPREYLIQTENSSYRILVLDLVDSSLVEDFIKENMTPRDEKIDEFMKDLDLKKPKNIN